MSNQISETTEALEDANEPQEASQEATQVVQPNRFEELSELDDEDFETLKDLTDAELDELDALAAEDEEAEQVEQSREELSSRFEGLAELDDEDFETLKNLSDDELNDLTELVTESGSVDEALEYLENEEPEEANYEAALKAQASQLAALRSMVKELRTEAAVANAQASQAAAGVRGIDPDQMESVGTPNVLNLQNQLNELVSDPARVSMLQSTLASMQANPNMYPDLNTRCSQDAMENVLEGIAEALVQQGMSPAEAGLQAQIQLWKMDNPYQYVYTASQPQQQRQQQQVKPPTPKQVVPSPAAVSGGGGGKNSSGWTAAKLDSMSESQLDSVPPDIYQKWLIGQLK